MMTRGANGISFVVLVCCSAVKLALVLSGLFNATASSSLADRQKYNYNNNNLQNYGYKYRFTRYGDVDNCGKRKRNLDNRKCFRSCKTDADCKGSKRRCLCDGACGLSCVRITTFCNKVGKFDNGYVTYHPDNYFGGELIYECNPGFVLVGNRVRNCEGDGWWSGSSPVCQKETFCELPPSVLNAIPNVQVNNQSKYKVGTEIEYQCDIGFTASFNQDDQNDFSNKIVCLDDGKWSHIRFKCIRINCGKPDNIENGIINSNDYYYSSVIEYKCNDGYRIRHGDYLRECDLDGRWSGRKPTCEPIDCGEPPVVENSQSSYNGTSFDSRVRYTCKNDNYYLVGESRETYCMGNGLWNMENLPVCIEKNCTLNTQEYSKTYYNIFASNKTIGDHVYPVNTIIQIFCMPGYKLDGATQLKCMNAQSDGMWSDNLPVCRQELTCPFVNPPEFGLISTNKQSTSQGYSVNTTLEFTCIQGYKLVGSKMLICVEQEPGRAEWRGGDKVTCVMSQTTSSSSSTSSTSSTSIIGTTTLVEAKARDASAAAESCKIDPSSILISYRNQINTQFESAANDFVFVNGSIGSFIDSGSSVSYHCRSQAMITYVARCDNGTLIMEQNCNELKESRNACGTPPKIAHGYNKYSSSLHGSKALYQCFNGFELSKGDGELRCVDGNWMGATPVCTKVNCPYPGQLENGKIFYIGTLSEYIYKPYMNGVGQNRQIRYECDEKYKLVGPNGSTCINGNWKPSIKQVKCIVDDSPNRSSNPTGSDEGKATALAYNSNKIILYRDKSLPTSANNSTAMRNKLKRLKKHKIKKNKLARLLNDDQGSIEQYFIQKRHQQQQQLQYDTSRNFIPNHRHEKKTYLNDFESHSSI